MNSNILAAIIIKWLEPYMETIAGSKLSSLPFFSNIEAKVRSTGWVSGNWSIMSELSPFAGSILNSLVDPILARYISQVPDEAIPAMAHNVVDTALKKGELSLLEGCITFDKGDLMQLKKLLNANLPCKKVEPIKLKEE